MPLPAPPTAASPGPEYLWIAGKRRHAPASPGARTQPGGSSTKRSQKRAVGWSRNRARAAAAGDGGGQCPCEAMARRRWPRCSRCTPVGRPGRSEWNLLAAACSLWRRRSVIAGLIPCAGVRSTESPGPDQYPAVIRRLDIASASLPMKLKRPSVDCCPASSRQQLRASVAPRLPRRVRVAVGLPGTPELPRRRRRGTPGPPGGVVGLACGPASGRHFRQRRFARRPCRRPRRASSAPLPAWKPRATNS